MASTSTILLYVGPSWAVFGPSWGRLGLSWGHLGLSWGLLGATLGPPGGPLGAILDPPGNPWGHPGGILAHKRATSGRPWVPLAPSWATLGPSWANFRPSWANLVRLGALLGPSGRLPDLFSAHLGGMLGPLESHLSAIFASSSLSRANLRVVIELLNLTFYLSFSSPLLYRSGHQTWPRNLKSSSPRGASAGPRSVYNTVIHNAFSRAPCKAP